MAMTKNRPLSPHLQVYRLPLTGLISITHRFTGILLSIGLVFCVCVLTQIASGESGYLQLQTTLNTLWVKLIYWGFIYALFFHLCHGVRHLIWDAGSGYRRETMTRFAVVELLSSVVLTVAVFFSY